MTRSRMLPVLMLVFGLGGCAAADSNRRDQVHRLDLEGQDLYEAATLRDALLGLPAALAAAADGSVAFVGFDSASPLKEELTAEATRVWSRAATAGEQRVVIVQYRPLTRRPALGKWWRAFRGALLPGLVDGRTCVVLIPDDAHFFAAGQPRLNRESIGRVLGPCAHAARFGPAGPAMRTWLGSTGHAGARSLDWLLLPSAVTPGLWWQYQGFEPEPDDLGDRWFPLAALVSGAEKRLPPYWLGLDAVGCLAGRVAQCVQLVTDSSEAHRPRAAARRIDGLVALRRDEGWSTPIGPVRWTSELIRQGGEDRFRALWASELRFDAAFAAIYHQPLGESVAGWARNEWEGRGGFSAVRLGPAADPVAIASAIGWAALFLLLAAVASKRLSPRG